MEKEKLEAICSQEVDKTELYDYMITLCSKTSRPNTVLQAIKEIDNMIQAQHDYMLSTFERYFFICQRGISEVKLLEDIDEEEVKAGEKIGLYQIIINGEQRITLSRMQSVKEKAMYNIVTVTVTDTVEKQIEIVVPVKTEEGDIDDTLDNDYSDVITTQMRQEAKVDVDRTYSDYQYSQEMTADEIRQSYNSDGTEPLNMSCLED